MPFTQMKIRPLILLKSSWTVNMVVHLAVASPPSHIDFLSIFHCPSITQAWVLVPEPLSTTVRGDPDSLNNALSGRTTAWSALNGE